MVHIDVDTTRRLVACDAGKRNSDLPRTVGESALSDRRAHSFEHFDKADVALQRMLIEPMDRNRETQGRSQGERITG